INLDKRFIAGYGARRSFDGSSRGLRKFGLGKFGILQTLFDSSVLLMDGLDWISRLDYSIKDGKIPEAYLEYLKSFINKTQLLHSIVMDKIDSSGIYFIDEFGYQMEAQYLSSGNQSILSLLLDILRELVEIYGLEKVFEDIGKEIPSINMPGIILIDEVDAHLHPTWQTRIGDWFTKYFPNMQFIVTTHSPLICRGAKNGTIWKLPNPGEMQGVQKITGLEKDKLVYGDILDAYSTEAFGKDIERSELGREKLKEFSQLSKKKAYGGNLTEGEQAEYDSLKGVFSNDAIY
ncbi:MAG TPA: AAA family ATPase, partial [Leptospiraceae bacterium]|nr:AAA family ATPase [Leptospiraceae bacterium]